MSLLEEPLAALSVASRRTILEALRQPSRVRELAERTHLTRQAVQQHLAVLARAGLVRRTEAPGRGHTYALDAAGLYAIHLGLGALAPQAQDLGQPTVVVQLAPGHPPRRPRGLWHLRGDGLSWVPIEEGRSWILGRGERSDLRLPYDPSMSAAHAVLQTDGAAWTVTDLRSTNGTYVNERRVAPGEASPVAHGDLLRLGRCCLVLYAH